MKTSIFELCVTSRATGATNRARNAYSKRKDILDNQLDVAVTYCAGKRMLMLEECRELSSPCV